MADITITAASVSLVAGTGTVVYGQANTLISAGQVVWFDDASTARWKLVVAATASTYVGKTIGVALNSPQAVNQPITVALTGDINTGVVLTAGVVYIIGSGSSKLAPSADLASTWYITPIGIATSTSVLRLCINRTDTQKA